MKHKLIITFCILLLGCKNEPCLRQEIASHKHHMFRMRETGSDFYFTDTSQVEFVNGKVFSISDVQWIDCSSYRLIIRSIVDTAALRSGDTVFFDISKGEGDEVKYKASMHGFSAEGSFYPVEQMKNDD